MIHSKELNTTYNDYEEFYNIDLPYWVFYNVLHKFNCFDIILKYIEENFNNSELSELNEKINLSPYCAYIVSKDGKLYLIQNIVVLSLVTSANYRMGYTKHLRDFLIEYLKSDNFKKFIIKYSDKHMELYDKILFNLEIFKIRKKYLKNIIYE